MYTSCTIKSGNASRLARYFPVKKRLNYEVHGCQVSALREAALAREIHDAGVATMNSLYMGALADWFVFVPDLLP